MGETRLPKPAPLTAVVFSCDENLIDAAISQMESRWGPAALCGGPFDFTETAYYQREMGPELRLKIAAFARLIDQCDLPDIKNQTNALEQELRQGSTSGTSSETGTEDERTVTGPRRTVNIDPGYLTEAKFVLATTKDRDHRLYLRDGIFAEITLRYSKGAWRASEWTYPNYRRDDYHRFLMQCRDEYRRRLHEGDA